MAIPAGYSSDEWSDDDDGLSWSIETKKPNCWYKPPQNDNLSKEEKLVQAVLDRQLEDVKKIVNSGVNIDYKSTKNNNWTALMHACHEGTFEIIKFLVENNASVCEHHELLTPLLCLCDSNHSDENELIKCLEVLIDYGADVNAVDWYKVNALVYAVKRGHEKLVSKLISVGCELEHADSEGWTPIFYAVQCGSLSIVKILKEAGANAKKTDRRGQSLIDFALDKNCEDIVAVIDSQQKTFDLENFEEFNKDRKSDYEYILTELPDRKKSRFNGFHSIAVQWISGVGLGSLAQLFVEKNVQLNELFTIDEEQLINLGVKIAFERQKLIFYIAKFHEYSWNNKSLRFIPENEPLNLCEVANLLVPIILHLHICSAATYFWKKHKSHPLSLKEKEYISKAIRFTRIIEREKNQILNIVKNIEKINTIIPPDLILPKQKKMSFKLKILLFASASICLLSVFKYKNIIR